MGLAELRKALGGDVLVVSDANAVAKEGARRFAAAAKRAVEERDRFLVALSGGTTPRTMYELLAQTPYDAMVDWDKVEFFFGDERTVPPTSTQSNYRTANDALLMHVGVDAAKVHRIEGERQPDKAARDYEMLLRSVGADILGTPETGLYPRMDLIFLGMGPDGHTASLFPGTAALMEQYRLVVENFVEKLNGWRITMTPAMINAAREVVFMIAGAEKAPVLKTISRGDADPFEHPVLLVKPTSGKLSWLLDRAATT